MSLDTTFDIVPVKYGTVKTTSEELFTNCPGSLNRKEYNSDLLWDQLIRDDHAINISVPKSGEYSVFAVIKDGKAQEYRLVINSDLRNRYESKSNDAIPDTRLEYEGYLYVDPKLMITDPQSFVSGETITVDTIKKSVKDGESILCDFGVSENNNCILVYVFQIFDEDDDTLEYRLTSNLELARFYATMLEGDDLETVTADLEKVVV
jgi:hypothetical protein